MAGLTFCGLALVQVFSYPFHDPVMTDRGFITDPKVMIKGFTLAGLVAGAFILLFSTVGLLGRALGLHGTMSVAVPAALGLPVLLVFNAIMLTSAGSTLDSTFASAAKLAGRDWPGQDGAPTEAEKRFGRRVMVAIAILGNLPLLSIYMGNAVGPAIIAATTISGTMVMGLAPIFLLSFVPGAGRASFHLAFWPGLVLGVLVTIEGAFGIEIFPALDRHRHRALRRRPRHQLLGPHAVHRGLPRRRGVQPLRARPPISACTRFLSSGTTSSSNHGLLRSHRRLRGLGCGVGRKSGRKSRHALTVSANVFARRRPGNRPGRMSPPAA